MKNLFSLIALQVLVITVFGQTEITNGLTNKHVNIIGTKISLIPPTGFVKAPNFSGLQQVQSGSTIMILDIPGPFAETSKALTKEAFLSQGVEVKEIEKLTINNLPALMVRGEQNAYGKIYTKYILCFGTEKETLMINCATPSNLNEISNSVKTSILTVVYEAEKKINPFEVIDYTIDATNSKIKFAKSISNSLIFTTDGLLPTKSTDKTSLIISKSFSKVSIEDRKLFCLNRLKQLPIDNTKTEIVSEIKVDGITGYEIIALGKSKKSGEDEKMYQVILFSDSLYYIFFGSTNENFDTNIAILKGIIKTFKRK